MTEQQPSGDSRFMGLVLMGASPVTAFCGSALGVMATVVTESSGGDCGSALPCFISGIAAAGGYAVFVAGRSL
jgi:hypothetical protein